MSDLHASIGADSMHDGGDELLRAALVSELQYLSGRAGATAARITVEATPKLRQLGAEYLKGQPGLGDEALSARQLLIDALPDLSTDQAGVVDSGLGLTVDGQSTADREKKMNLTGDATTRVRRRQAVWPSYAQRLIDRAMARPVGLRQAAENRASASGPSDSYRVESWEGYYKLKGDRSVDFLLTKIDLVASRPGRHVFPAVAQYMNDSRAGVLVPEELFGCRIIEKEDDRGTTFTKFQLADSLEVGERATIIYRVMVRSSIPVRPTLFVPVGHEQGAARLSVDFSATGHPSHIWRFSDIETFRVDSSSALRAADPERVTKEVSSFSWPAIRRGYCSGIDWDWDGVAPTTRSPHIDNSATR